MIALARTAGLARSEAQQRKGGGRQPWAILLTEKPANAYNFGLMVNVWQVRPPGLKGVRRGTAGAYTRTCVLPISAKFSCCDLDFGF